jgi:hypothetical protein
VRARAHQPPSLLALSALLVGSFTAPMPASGQGIKLAVGDVGLGIGDVRRLDGIRLNFRDDRLERVRGLNVTIWSPYEGADGVVQGIAVGLPLTGASEMSGLALGAGAGVERAFSGIAVTGIGFGAGDGITGVAVGGVGVGTGGSVKGLAIGGVGVGAGGDISGILIGGVGAGAGGNLKGIAIGGVGLGASGDLTGVAVGGVGVGAGGNVRGLLVGGVGVGAGGNVTGVTIGGVGVGAGGELKGVALGGIGVGAPRITGLAIGGFGAGGEEVRGLVIAPAWFRVEETGFVRGVSVSAFNDVRGAQYGVSIGLLNIADELHGLQVGLLNIARNKDSFSVLPILNYHR